MAPWWTPPPVTIRENVELAIAKHKEITIGSDPPLAIYSDGSGINGKVGAAAIASTLSTHAQAYLGEESTTTVYAAELIGALLAINIAIRARKPVVAIFTDNQAALKTRHSLGNTFLRGSFNA